VGSLSYDLFFPLEPFGSRAIAGYGACGDLLSLRHERLCNPVAQFLFILSSSISLLKYELLVNEI